MKTVKICFHRQDHASMKINTCTFPLTHIRFAESVHFDCFLIAVFEFNVTGNVAGKLPLSLNLSLIHI